ncbi:hypothetical protein [Roseofilum sp. Belize Diploria]|uniref:hypothetical protein n=1 Tax=Roseofilum sp. Belize Diploria TaxID=2821501 RepID=UPI000E8F4F2F|nr:hypothetical protein [Roseofilum sp. Belize Diploria]MBP0010391.1 hypothetical protein [Roseofilum sp. Belize Diploria]HBQ99399.1 hypothetical protein [Cyanobacteria bacterium UBA11691]
MRYKSTACYVTEAGEIIATDSPLLFDGWIHFHSRFEAQIYLLLKQEFPAEKGWQIRRQFPVRLFRSNTKDSCSLIFNPDKAEFVTWIEDETYLVLITNSRPTELASRYEDHDLYALAFNKKEYKVKNFETNAWDKRSPTEVEK